MIYSCDPIDIIVRGTAIYGHHKNFDITEVSLYPIGYLVRKTGFSSTIIGLTNKNARIPTNQYYNSHNLGRPTASSNVPIFVDIHQKTGQGVSKVDPFQVGPMDQELFDIQYHIIKTLTHQIIIGVKDTGDVFVKSAFVSDDTKTSIDLKTHLF